MRNNNNHIEDDSFWERMQAQFILGIPPGIALQLGNYSETHGGGVFSVSQLLVAFYFSLKNLPRQGPGQLALVTSRCMGTITGFFSTATLMKNMAANANMPPHEPIAPPNVRR